MDINKLKQLLYSYSYIQFKIDATNENLSNLATIIDTQRGVSSPVLTGLPGTHNISDPVAEAAERIIDKYCHEYARFENELEELFCKKHTIDNLISVLNPLQKQIIELKYFKKYKWWMVAQTMKYSERQCRRKCNEALRELQLLQNTKT